MISRRISLASYVPHSTAARSGDAVSSSAGGIHADQSKHSDRHRNWIPPVSILNPSYPASPIASAWPSAHDCALSCAATDFALLCSESPAPAKRAMKRVRAAKKMAYQENPG